MTQFQWKRTHAAELRTYWSNFDASSQFADNFALQQSTFPPNQVPASFSPISSWRPGVSLKAIGTDAQTQDACSDIKQKVRNCSPAAKL